MSILKRSNQGGASGSPQIRTRSEALPEFSGIVITPRLGNSKKKSTNAAVAEHAPRIVKIAYLSREASISNCVGMIIIAHGGNNSLRCPPHHEAKKLPLEAGFVTKSVSATLSKKLLPPPPPRIDFLVGSFVFLAWTSSESPCVSRPEERHGDQKGLTSKYSGGVMTGSWGRPQDSLTSEKVTLEVSSFQITRTERCHRASFFISLRDAFNSTSTLRIHRTLKSDGINGNTPNWRKNVVCKCCKGLRYIACVCMCECTMARKQKNSELPNRYLQKGKREE